MLKRIVRSLSSGGFLLLVSGSLYAQFEEVSIVFEQNKTDRDYEVVFTIEGGDEGFETLRVLDPDRRVVLDTSTSGGIRQYHLESPEPSRLEELKLLYPEGTYLIEATSLSQSRYTAFVELSYLSPESTSLVQPVLGDTNVSTTTAVSWGSVADAVQYIIEIESENSAEELLLTLDAPTTLLNLPVGFLKPGTDYEIQIGTVAANGNKTFVEGLFTTAN